MSRSFAWISLLALLSLAGGSGLWAQSAPAALPKAENKATTDPAGGATLESVASNIAKDLRWRVGGSFAVSHGTIEPGAPKNPRNSMPDEGFSGEFALYATVVPAERTRGHARVCYGCHGLEVESAYFEYRPTDMFSFRAGRFNIPMGGNNDRHDQSLRHTVSKSLSNIMGLQVRQNEFNQGILPAPATDNGFLCSAKGEIESLGVTWGLDAFAVAGLEGTGNQFNPDIGFIQSRNMKDNNGEPAFGGRAEFAGDRWSFGGSFMTGNYDADARRAYQIFVIDARYNIGAFTVQAQYASRRTEYTDASSGEGHWMKTGLWLQGDYRLNDSWRVVAAVDTLDIDGIYLGTFGPTANLPGAVVTKAATRVLRGTGGITWSPYPNLTVKGSAEFWDFSDFYDATVFHIGAVWTF